MKRTLVALVALLTMAAFAGGVMAQAPAKTVDKPAAAATGKSAGSAAEKPKAEAPKAEKKPSEQKSASAPAEKKN